MKELLIYQSKWIGDKIDEETGEVIETSHTEEKAVIVPMDKIIQAEPTWEGLKLITLDGPVMYENIKFFMFR